MRTRGCVRVALTLVAVLVLVAGCVSGGGGAGADRTATAAAATPAATLPPTAVPTPAVLQATVKDVVNEVEADPLALGAWERAEPEMTIYARGKVQAHEASTARVLVEAGLVRVAPNTTFTFLPEGEDTVRLNLEQGQMWINVEGEDLEGKTLEVETPGAVASVRGTRFGVRVEEDETTVVSTQVGTVTVRSLVPGGPTVDVGAWQQTTVRQGGPPSPPEPMPLYEWVWWGMAQGQNLDVVFPATDVVGEFTFMYEGPYLSSPSVSPGCGYFAANYYAEIGEDKYESYGILYDVQQNRAVTETLPEGVRGVSFNPAGDGMVYVLSPSQICTANTDGSNPSCWGGEDVYYDEPRWSPDGNWLAFVGGIPQISIDGQVVSEGGAVLFSARPDGSDLTQLTPAQGAYNGSPAWSSDGSRIAYLSFPDYGQPADLWVMNADGADPYMVYSGLFSFFTPIWSPDGSWLLVHEFGYGHYGEGGEIFLVSPDVAGTAGVTQTVGFTAVATPTVYWDPAWSPTSDGWPLMFHSPGLEKGQKGLWYVTGPDEQPAYLASAAFGPVWSAGGDCAAFGAVSEIDSQAHLYEMTVYIFRVARNLWP